MLRTISTDAIAYLTALITVSFTVFVATQFSPDQPAPFYPFLLAAILVITAKFGRGPGYAAVTLGSLLLAYFALSGAGFAVADPLDAIGLIGFVAAGIVGVVLVAGLVRDLAVARAAARLSLRNEELITAQREFGHRLNNDLNALAATAALRSLGAAPETAAALREIIERIEVLGRVYRRLQVDLGAGNMVQARIFLNGLCDDLRLAHLSLRPIALVVEIEDFEMPSGKAVTMGLIVNELLANACKHAFPDDRQGTVTVSLKRHPTLDYKAELIVSDDGIGLRDGAPGGMGQRLVAAMASQLGGTYWLSRRDGQTVAQVVFSVPPPR